MLMDYWDASWLIKVILPSVLSITSPSGHLTLMLLGKKVSIWKQSCYHTICYEFTVSLFGNCCF